MSIVRGGERRGGAGGRPGREAAELVFLDIDMPELDGIEACRRLRAEPAGANATIVMLTAAARDEAEREAEEAGADLFLTKPFSPLELLRLVDELGQGRSGLTRGYLGLGSNQGDRLAEPARRPRPRSRRADQAVAASSVYETAPQGEVLDQPDFLNAVVGDRDRARSRTTLLDAVQGGRARAGPRARRPPPRSAPDRRRPAAARRRAGHARAPDAAPPRDHLAALRARAAARARADWR